MTNFKPHVAVPATIAAPPGPESSRGAASTSCVCRDLRRGQRYRVAALKMQQAANLGVQPPRVAWGEFEKFHASRGASRG